jgi:hypothetical protein
VIIITYLINIAPNTTHLDVFQVLPLLINNSVIDIFVYKFYPDFELFFLGEISLKENY